MIDVFLLIHDFVHFLCWPKENEPKERAFFGPHKVVIFACGKTTLSCAFLLFFIGQLESPFFICVCCANWFLVVILQAEISFF
ncbi:MAG: hypothetical protein CFE24_08640 [Flavobacterium sp. BFFFF2]|nr:MAG: hypothetical protein CFE24_08640 [Flavobacterium sp. BFFFF2]